MQDRGRSWNYLVEIKFFKKPDEVVAQRFQQAIRIGKDPQVDSIGEQYAIPCKGDERQNDENKRLPGNDTPDMTMLRCRIRRGDINRQIPASPEQIAINFVPYHPTSWKPSRKPSEDAAE